MPTSISVTPIWRELARTTPSGLRSAVCESFFATLERELLDRSRSAGAVEARAEIFEFIEGFYNLRRRHSVLGYLSPHDFEAQHADDAEILSLAA